MGLFEGYPPELVTDLYQFTMAASYWREGMFKEATFSLFVRDYPPNRAYFVAAGINELLQSIADFRIHPPSLAYLESLHRFDSAFLDYLSSLRFEGSVRALREGRIFFAQEPILEVTAPIIQAQLIETMVMNALHFEILVATKASRCLHAARGRPLVDFSLRRTHGVDAALKTARSSYLVGFMGTSNLLAGRIYGIPVYGTMAHSYITGFPSEMEAFQAYARAFPDGTVLLLDTYDSLAAARKAVVLALELRRKGLKLRGVRLDSGDLVNLSRHVRAIFRENHVEDVAIMASGNLDEYRIDELLQQGAEIDVIGIGTRLGVSADAPYLDLAYKMVEYASKPVVKLSPGKVTWAGRKQVYRHYDSKGFFHRDQLALQEEFHIVGEPLLEPAIVKGEWVRSFDSLEAARDRFLLDWNRIPEPYKALRPEKTYPVIPSDLLRIVQHRITQDRQRTEVPTSQ